MLNIVEKILKEKEKKITIYPVKSNQASQLGHPCLRYLVHNRLDWDKKPKHSVKTQLLFDEGNNQEQLVIRDMIDAGIKVEGLQQYFTWEKYQITGKVDGFIRDNSHLYPFEIKSIHPYHFDLINSKDDLKKKIFLQKYLAQITLYLLMANTEQGFLIFKNKSTGELKQIDITLDYELGEELIQKAEKVNNFVAENKYPDPIEYNEETCTFCPFQSLCPATKTQSEAQILQDEDFENDLSRWYELKKFVKEYDELDKKIKSKLEGIPYIQVGPFFIEGKFIESTKYNIPPDIKKQYAEKYQYWKITKIIKIQDIKL